MDRFKGIGARATFAMGNERHAAEAENRKATEAMRDMDGGQLNAAFDILSRGPDMKTYIGTKVVQALPEVRGNQFGYAVIYSDGYRSWSPKAVFEASYHSPETASFDFGTAISLLKQGRAVTRRGWNGKDMWLCLQTPDEYSKMQRPYIYMSPVGGELVPWVASQSDVLAEDWILAG